MIFPAVRQDRAGQCASEASSGKARRVVLFPVYWSGYYLILNATPGWHIQGIETAHHNSLPRSPLLHVGGEGAGGQRKYT